MLRPTRVSVRTRLRLSLAVLALMTVLISLIAVVGVGQLSTARQDVADATDVRKVRRSAALASATVASEVTRAALTSSRGSAAYRTPGTPEREAWEAAGPELQEAIAELDAAPTSVAEKTSIARIDGQIAEILRLNDAMLAAYASPDAGAVAATLPSVDRITELSTDVGETAEGLVDAAAEQADAVSADAASLESKLTALGWILGVLGVLVAVGAIVWISRTVLDPLARLLARLEDVADGEGDLRTRLEVTSDDELGQIAEALNRFLGKTEATIAQIGSDASSLRHAVSGLSQVNQRLSGSSATTATQTQTVSSAAEEISVTMAGTASAAEQMSAASGQIAGSASEAARLATDGARLADEAMPLVTGLVSAANEISSVVMLIQDVASQTKMLALNASIEAARAGEAGEGFAVVANEVKDLAAQTAEAATQVHERIATVQAQASQAATAIDDIAGHMQRVNDSQGEIARAVQEQTATTGEIARGIGEASTGAAEIARSITEIAEATAGASGLLEETTGSIADLRAVADRLHGLSGQFTTTSTRGRGPAPTADVSGRIPAQRGPSRTPARTR